MRDYGCAKKKNGSKEGLWIQKKDRMTELKGRRGGCNGEKEEEEGKGDVKNWNGRRECNAEILLMRDGCLTSRTEFGIFFFFLYPFFFSPSLSFSFSLILFLFLFLSLALSLSLTFSLSLFLLLLLSPSCKMMQHFDRKKSWILWKHDLSFQWLTDNDCYCALN